MSTTTVFHNPNLCLGNVRQNLWEETTTSAILCYSPRPFLIIHCLLTCATSLMIAQWLCCYHASFTQSSRGGNMEGNWSNWAKFSIQYKQVGRLKERIAIQKQRVKKKNAQQRQLAEVRIDLRGLESPFYCAAWICWETCTNAVHKLESTVNTLCSQKTGIVIGFENESSLSFNPNKWFTPSLEDH